MTEVTVYHVEASRLSRGMSLVCCPAESDLVRKSRAAGLAWAFSNGRYSYQERGYLMDSVALSHFTRAVRLGCKSPDGQKVEWESADDDRFWTFSAKHPARALREIAREAY